MQARVRRLVAATLAVLGVLGLAARLSAASASSPTLAPENPFSRYHRISYVRVADAGGSGNVRYMLKVLPLFPELQCVGGSLCGSTFTGGTVSNATTFSSAVTFSSTATFNGATTFNATATFVSPAKLQMQVGSVAAPSINFTGDTATGIYQRSIGEVEFGISGIEQAAIATGGITLPSGGQLRFASGALGTSLDAGLARAAAGQVKVTNGGAGNGILRVPGGTPTAPAIDLGPTAGFAGISSDSNNHLYAIAGAATFFDLDAASGEGIGMGSTQRLTWRSGAVIGTAGDSGFSRAAAGVITMTAGASGSGWLQQSAGYLALNADYTNATATFSSTALVTAASVISGRTYSFDANLRLSDSVAADGAQINFNAGTAAATNFWAYCVLNDLTVTVEAVTETTTLAGAHAKSALTGTGDNLWHCHGSFVPSSTGTFGIQGAQNTHSTGTLTIKRGSDLRLDDVNPL